MDRPTTESARARQEPGWMRTIVLNCAVVLLAACAPPPTAGGARGDAHADASRSPGSDVRARYAGAPAWVTEGCRAYWPSATQADGIVCGIGTAAANRNPNATRETAIARARAAVARSVEVTIESLVRLEDRAQGDGELDSIIHQLTSASLPGAKVESVWRSTSGETHALVSLRVADVQHSLRTNESLTQQTREAWAARAAEAFSRSRAIPAERND